VEHGSILNKRRRKLAYWKTFNAVDRTVVTGYSTLLWSIQRCHTGSWGDLIVESLRMF